MGVIFQDENGKQHEAVLANDRHSEVIMSSGAIGTPQLLMLSGIGPKEELQKLNIPVILDNHFVGKGMVDNPMNTMFVPSERPVHQSLIETVGITKMGVYIEASSGFSQSNDSIHCHHGIVSAEVCSISLKSCQNIGILNNYFLHFETSVLLTPLSFQVISEFYNTTDNTIYDLLLTLYFFT